MKWTDLQVQESAHISYEAITREIFSGTYSQCKLDRNIFPCQHFKFVHGISSRDPKDNEGFTGSDGTNLVEKVKRFKMLYFTMILDMKCEICQTDEEELIETRQKKETKNAFDLLMSARKNDSVPQKIDKPKDKKDELYNFILDYIVENCRVTQSIRNLTATFIEKLRDVLWYIDGHSSTMEIRSENRIPSFFEQFAGFNRPEKSKHRKRTIENLSSEKLKIHCLNLKEVLLCMPFLRDTEEWQNIHENCSKLIDVIESYLDYLKEKRVKMRLINETPRTTIEDGSNITVLRKNVRGVNDALVKLNNAVKLSAEYQPLNIREYLESGIDRQRVHYIIEILKKEGLSSTAVFYGHIVGGNKPAMFFVWKIQENINPNEQLVQILNATEIVKKNIPVYERRITKKEFMNTYSFAAPRHVLREIFQNLTNDNSADINLDTKEINERLKFALMCGDPNMLTDLRHFHKGKPDKYHVFFQAVEDYLKVC